MFALQHLLEDLKMVERVVECGTGRFTAEFPPGVVAEGEVVVPYLELFPFFSRARVWEELGDEPSVLELGKALGEHCDMPPVGYEIRDAGFDVYLVKTGGLKNFSVVGCRADACLRVPMLWTGCEEVSGFCYLSVFPVFKRALAASVHSVEPRVGDVRATGLVTGAFSGDEPVKALSMGNSIHLHAHETDLSHVRIDSLDAEARVGAGVCGNLGGEYAGTPPCNLCEVEDDCRVSTMYGFCREGVGFSRREELDHLGRCSALLAGDGWTAKRVDAVWLDLVNGQLAEKTDSDLHQHSVSDVWRPVVSPHSNVPLTGGYDPLNLASDFMGLTRVCQCRVGVSVLHLTKGHWAFLLEPGDSVRYAGGMLLAKDGGMIVCGQDEVKMQARVRKGLVATRYFGEDGWTRFMHKGLGWSPRTSVYYAKSVMDPSIFYQPYYRNTMRFNPGEIGEGVQSLQESYFSSRLGEAFTLQPGRKRGAVPSGENGVMFITGGNELYITPHVLVGPGLTCMYVHASCRGMNIGSRVGFNVGKVCGDEELIVVPLFVDDYGRDSDVFQTGLFRQAYDRFNDDQQEEIERFCVAYGDDFVYRVRRRPDADDGIAGARTMLQAARGLAQMSIVFNNRR